MRLVQQLASRCSQCLKDDTVRMDVLGTQLPRLRLTSYDCRPFRDDLS